MTNTKKDFHVRYFIANCDVRFSLDELYYMYINKDLCFITYKDSKSLSVAEFEDGKSFIIDDDNSIDDLILNNTMSLNCLLYKMPLRYETKIISDNSKYEIYSNGDDLLSLFDLIYNKDEIINRKLSITNIFDGCPVQFSEDLFFELKHTPISASIVRFVTPKYKEDYLRYYLSDCNKIELDMAYTGLDVGLKIGYVRGYNDGYTDGADDGYKEGYARGYNDGY